MARTPRPQPGTLIDLAIQLHRDEAEPRDALRSRDRAIGQKLTPPPESPPESPSETPPEFFVPLLEAVLSLEEAAAVRGKRGRPAPLKASPNGRAS